MLFYIRGWLLASAKAISLVMIFLVRKSVRRRRYIFTKCQAVPLIFLRLLLCLSHIFLYNWIWLCTCAAFYWSGTLMPQWKKGREHTDQADWIVWVREAQQQTHTDPFSLHAVAVHLFPACSQRGRWIFLRTLWGVTYFGVCVCVSAWKVTVSAASLPVALNNRTSWPHTFKNLLPFVVAGRAYFLPISWRRVEETECACLYVCVWIIQCTREVHWCRLVQPGNRK